MGRLVVNLAALVVSPALVVTGFVAGIRRLLRGRLAERTSPGDRTALLVIALGLYFLGHPLYPALVPLIRASTPWLFAVGGAYFTLGAVAFVAARARRFSAFGAHVAALLAVVVAVLAANGTDVGAVVRLAGANDLGPSLYVSISMALLFAFGYDDRDDRDDRASVRLLIVAFASFALVFANSIPLTERVLGPVGLFFVVFGFIGVLLGIPTYLLGRAIGAAVEES
ncbi:hypothetical protein M0R88_16355 [Halorussus gelatinilyticus]|uniref:Uncharacterized protein n=1 Tax=Halorussus gelatinilyticus TaxID=2937524 RepID=A0A8U0IGF9_9EURY|nr:hypothetical protein [Halorussus gelatinilyticus]UPW00073.1 hypothetical protein M0R88_16355 [Halorussus gelatinilyticus]